MNTDNIFSYYFTREEFEHSDIAIRHGISNKMGPSELENSMTLCGVYLDVIRAYIGKPVIITSGYRNLYINNLAGGSKTSAHVQGCAADIHVPGMSITDLYETIYRLVKNRDIPKPDQCIWEKGQWVHIGIKPNSKDNRGQWLKYDGKVYAKYPVSAIKEI